MGSLTLTLDIHHTATPIVASFPTSKVAPKCIQHEDRVVLLLKAAASAAEWKQQECRVRLKPMSNFMRVVLTNSPLDSQSADPGLHAPVTFREEHSKIWTVLCCCQLVLDHLATGTTQFVLHFQHSCIWFLLDYILKVRTIHTRR